jgi:predicted nucleic acid-binding protein
VRVVIDANALVAFVTNEPASPAVAQLLDGWNSQDTPVNAPALARYEIANALTKKAAAGNLTNDETQEAWDVVEELPIIYYALHDGPGVVQVALALKRRSAYDAAYLNLAKDLGADLWTLDGPLARNASAHGYPVHLIVSPEQAPSEQDVGTEGANKVQTDHPPSGVTATTEQDADPST